MQTKNPEVMLLPLLNRQFALDPCRPVFAGYLRTRRTISTWAPGLPPTGIGLNASGSCLALDSFLVSSTGGSLLTVAVPLLPLRCRRGAVNWLQPRTHQPTGKTWETVKERVCCTPAIFEVNINCAVSFPLFSMKCGSSTGV